MARLFLQVAGVTGENLPGSGMTQRVLAATGEVQGVEHHVQYMHISVYAYYLSFVHRRCYEQLTGDSSRLSVCLS
jgi:hypothetical protein